MQLQRFGAVVQAVVVESKLAKGDEVGRLPALFYEGAQVSDDSFCLV